MRVQSSRFGSIEVERASFIRFPKGMIGFPHDKTFVLLQKEPGSAIGWLQSTTNPTLAFPVASIEALEADYPLELVEQLPAISGVKGSASSMAVMVVITASGGGSQATVNLLSPIVVNADTMTGAQVVLDQSPLSTQEPFRVRAGAGAQAPAAACVARSA